MAEKSPARLSRVTDPGWRARGDWHRAGHRCGPGARLDLQARHREWRLR